MTMGTLLYGFKTSQRKLSNFIWSQMYSGIFYLNGASILLKLVALPKKQWFYYPDTLAQYYYCCQLLNRFTSISKPTVRSQSDVTASSFQNKTC